MKVNVQIYTTKALADVIACDLSGKLDYTVVYKEDSCALGKDGVFHLVYRDCDTGLFSKQLDVPAYEIAGIVNMPFWEVIGVDQGGFDDYALMFYEQG